jgi:hypothetical protein
MVWTVFTMQSACTSSKLLPVLDSTVKLGFGSRRDQWSCFCSFQTFTWFKMRRPLRREDSSDYYWWHRLYWGSEGTGPLAPLVCYMCAVYGRISELQNFVPRPGLDIPFKEPRVILSSLCSLRSNTLASQATGHALLNCKLPFRSTSYESCKKYPSV